PSRAPRSGARLADRRESGRSHGSVGPRAQYRSVVPLRARRDSQMKTRFLLAIQSVNSRTGNFPHRDRAAATGSKRQRVRRAFIRSAARACLLTFLGLVAIGVQAAAATTWYVDGTFGSDTNSCTAPGFGSACRTIQAAINKASNGDTIRVALGMYNENVVVNKRLMLLGAQAG